MIKKTIETPSTDDIRIIIKQMKKGTVPGPDEKESGEIGHIISEQNRNEKAVAELYQLLETDTESSAPSDENEQKINRRNKFTPDFLYT
ncbi:hypothetical protein EVAR_60453_1 [Eumeta japonica]|uniref:Uncharacterized protein n=1 Tax=Eumeta variegata TaxID=151549 RepID=A0A4C1Z4P4_EUMVA|nr:hypothetical protein EVAR_60453_1 [Eumeta japonica]